MREGERGSQARRGKARVSPKQRSESKKKAALDPSVLHSASLWRRVSSHFSLFAAAKGHGGGGRREREREKEERRGREGTPDNKNCLLSLSRSLSHTQTHRHTHTCRRRVSVCVCFTVAHTGKPSKEEKERRTARRELHPSLFLTLFSSFSPSLPLPPYPSLSISLYLSPPSLRSPLSRCGRDAPRTPAFLSPLCFSPFHRLLPPHTHTHSLSPASPECSCCLCSSDFFSVSRTFPLSPCLPASSAVPRLRSCRRFTSARSSPSTRACSPSAKRSAADDSIATSLFSLSLSLFSLRSVCRRVAKGKYFNVSSSSSPFPFSLVRILWL